MLSIVEYISKGIAYSYRSFTCPICEERLADGDLCEVKDESDTIHFAHVKCMERGNVS